MLDVGSEPISGRIEGGERFTGWVQLAAALDALNKTGLGTGPSVAGPAPLDVTGPISEAG